VKLGKFFLTLPRRKTVGVEVVDYICD